MAPCSDSRMPEIFAYRAAASDGRVTDGTLDAESIEEARASIRSIGLYPLEIESRGSRRAQRTAISAADLALGLRVLADLLDSGLPVSRALHALEDLAPKGWQRALPQIRQSVREGQSLAFALGNAPIEIPALVIGIAQAGEAGAGIGSAIRRAAELTESISETRSAVKAALAYPAVVAVAGVGAITVLITVVLPRFAKILADLGQALPMSTRIVLAIANHARVLMVPVVVVVVIGGISWRTWVSTDSGRRGWHRLLLSIPLVGSIRRASAVARMAHALGAMLESGVALPFAARATADAELEHRIMAVRGLVTSGHTLSHALDAESASTATAVRL